MGRYDFASVGAAGGNAIQEFLVQRAMRQRQAMLDQLAVQAQQNEQKQKAADLELRTGQERRIAEAQKATQEDLANQREFGRASTIAENAMPGDTADEQTRALLEKQGYGGQIKKVPGVVSQGALQSTDENGIPTYDVNQSPDSFQMRGGSKYLAQQEAERARAEAASAAQKAAEERAAADRDLRREIAQGQNAGAAETRGLRNDLLRAQVDAAKQKQDDASQVHQKALGSMKSYGDDVLNVVNALIDESGNLKPDAAGIVGGFDGAIPRPMLREPSQNAVSDIDRLQALLDIGRLQDMKQQSRTGATGFGALNEKELGIIESSAAKLRNRRQSEGNYAAELKRIRDQILEGRAATQTTTTNDAAARAAALIQKYGGR